MLKFTLLGTPNVLLDERPLTGLATSKAWALLYYLAVTRVPHTRAALAGFFWADKPEAKARANLRYLLSNMRGLLASYLDITRDHVALRLDSSWQVDLYLLRDALNEARQTRDLSQLQLVIDLYKGDFLAGFHVRNAPEFEAWMAVQREQVRTNYLQGLEFLAEESITQREYTVGLAATRQALAIEPWAEVAHRQQMQLLVLNGQSGAALSHYDLCCRILLDEVGVSPAPATQELANQIRNGISAETPAAINRPSESGLLAEEGSTDDGHLAPSPRQSIPHNLPAPLTALVGRQQELALLGDQLLDPACRLLTIVGLGGMGKTHLAEETARRMLAMPACSRLFSDGVYWVPLVDIVPDKATDMDDAIALAALDAMGVELAGNSTISQQLEANLQAKHCLIVLDNFEHLTAYAPFVTDLLRTTPGLTVLATSRESLNVDGEWRMALEGLLLPSAEDEAWSEAEAAALFLQEARQHVPRFMPNSTDAAQIERICRLVEGFPLAIKLAASWLSLLDCTSIADEIVHSLDILTAQRQDVPARHRTMHAVFDSSWRMLTREEQQILMRLSLFRGPILQQAARQVAQAPLVILRRFVEHSFLRVDEDKHYTIHELFRQYLAEQRRQHHELDAETQRAFCDFFAQWVKAHVPTLTESNSKAVVQLVRQQRNNVHHTWAIALTQRNACLIEQLWKETKDLHDFYAYYQDGLTLFEDAITRLQDVASPLLLGYLHMAKATYYERFWRSADAFAALERTVLLFDSQAEITEPMAEGYRLFGSYLVQKGRYAEAEPRFARALQIARQFGDQQCESHTLRWMASSRGNQGEHRAAYHYAQEALAVSQKLTDRFPEIFCWLELGACQSREGKFDQKIEFLAKALDISHFINHRPSEQRIHVHLSETYIKLGVYDQAFAYIDMAYQIALEGDMFSDRLRSLTVLAHLYNLQEDYARACHVIQQVIGHSSENDFTSATYPIFITLGRAQFGQREWGEATTAYQHALQHRQRAAQEHFVAESLAGLADVALAQGNVSVAQSHVETILSLLPRIDLGRASDPLQIYLTCYQVLEQSGDMRASTVLAEGYGYLQTNAALLENVEMRQSYLENVRSHRKITALWANHGVKHVASEELQPILSIS